MAGFRNKILTHHETAFHSRMLHHIIFLTRNIHFVMWTWGHERRTRTLKIDHDLGSDLVFSLSLYKNPGFGLWLNSSQEFRGLDSVLRKWLNLIISGLIQHIRNSFWHDPLWSAINLKFNPPLFIIPSISSILTSLSNPKSILWAHETTVVPLIGSKFKPLNSALI